MAQLSSDHRKTWLRRTKPIAVIERRICYNRYAITDKTTIILLLLERKKMW